MRVTQAALNRYKGKVNVQAQKASEFVSRALDAYYAENPGANTADGRNFAIALLETALPNFTDAAGTLAVDFFDEMMMAEGIDAYGQLYDTTDYSIVEDKVHFFAEKLNAGDIEAFKREIVDVTHFFVKRSAYENMLRNCEANNVRYARVPSGFETCAFCVMLASRGFVYRSEERAAGHGGYHIGCDCCIVPGKKGRTVIEGYDPAGMHERWLSCEKAIGGDRQARLDWDALPQKVRNDYIQRHENEDRAFSQFKTNRILNEVEKRDWEWVYTGTCRQTRLRNHPEALRIKKTYPEAYKEWQAAVSQVKSLKTAQSQRKHVLWTSQFGSASEPPSFFTVDWDREKKLDTKKGKSDTIRAVRALIDEYAGRGYPTVTKEGKWLHSTEIVVCDDIIGCNRQTTSETRAMKLHYGLEDRKIHAVPRFDAGGESDGSGRHEAD